MGRKKRKLATDAEDGSGALTGSALPDETVPIGSNIKLEQEEDDDVAQQVPPVPPAAADVKQPPPSQPAAPLVVVTTSTMALSAEGKASKAAASSSGYSMTTHSGDILEDDIYISDGSEDEDEYGTAPTDKDVEILLTGSRMGVMRRGLHHPLLVQTNRQWVRPDHQSATTTAGGEKSTDENNETEEEAEERRRRQEEEELAKLDPAQRAARLLAEKQRKLEEAKEKARMLESEENAGRDPCLFSKRTSFDIRFDSIEDKPWTRGVGDLTDYFNYGLTEEDWLEYSQQQLMIRQELTDANRQKRPLEPAIVPVMPRKPRSQNPRVAVASSHHNRDMDDDMDHDGTEPMLVVSDNDEEVIGPFLVPSKKEEATSTNGGEESQLESMAIQHHQPYDVPVGTGGAWGAGAAPGSVLARLIEEQERNEGTAPQGASVNEQDAYNNDEYQTHQEDESSQNYQSEANSYQERGDYAATNYHEPSWRGGRGGNRPGGFQNRYGQEHAPYGNFQPPAPPPPPPTFGQPPFRGRGYGGNNNFYRGAPRPPYGGGTGAMPPPPPWAAGGGGRGVGRGGGGDFQRKRPREDFQDDGRWRR